MSEHIREPEIPANVPTVPVKSVQPTYGRVTPADDLLLLQRLREGDEATFASLFDQYCPSMARLARFYVSNPVVAEEVVQEVWLAVIRGLSRFEGRCSLKTWIFRILMNIAITRGQHESRSVPFSSLAGEEGESFEPAFDAGGSWVSSLSSGGNEPEERLLSQEIRSYIRIEIETLPPRQREVIILRDLEGWTAGEVCELFEISEVNQRVLLHRARSRVRHTLDRYFNEDGGV
jgi:RNA polymerase sigma-70 factor, ECF subfamily